jgi:two-component system response regulator AtoC
MVDQSLTNLGQSPQPSFLDFGETESNQPFMLMIEGMIKQVGQTDFPVLMHGETGAGKEVLARQIHACSRRTRGRFVKVNCAAFPTELVESELFGYEKGAFSGAFHQRQGLFETAHEGTILLDEIGDMDVRLQAKLLQVLQDGEFRRLGGRDLVRVDVRIMAATHQDLRQAIEDGRFREDLYYRLNVVTITIPPLRERRSEIIPLAESFLKKYSSEAASPHPLTPSLCEAMLTYDWPGNVRELENVMRKLLVVRNPVLLAKELLATKRKAAPSAHHKVTALQKPEGATGNEVDGHHSTPLGRIKRMKEVAERDAMVSALRSTNWNRRRAATLLGIDYKALLYRLKKLGIAEEVS